MDIHEFMSLGKVSPTLFHYIADYYQIPRDAKISMVSPDHTAVIEPVPLEVDWSYFQADELPATVNYQTTKLEFLEFGSNVGERVRATYSPQTNTLYIREKQRQVYRTPQPSSPRFWKRRTGESLLVWGERIHKTGAIDDPEKRWAYQVAVMSAPKTLLTKLKQAISK